MIWVGFLSCSELVDLHLFSSFYLVCPSCISVLFHSILSIKSIEFNFVAS